MELQGWIQLHRKFIDWEWYDDINTKVLFIHCLLKANHTAKKWRGIDIQRGDFLTSLNHLSSETGLSVRSIRTSLTRLESTGEVTRKATSKMTQLTICKYDTYNNLKKSNDTVNDTNADTQTTSKRHSDDTQTTTTNNDNNKKKENNKESNWLSKAKPEYLEFCESYFKMLESHGKINKNTNWRTKAWYDAARLMVEADDNNLETMNKALNFISKRITDEFCPQAWSLPSLRSKWLRLKEYSSKFNKKSQNEGRNNA